MATLNITEYESLAEDNRGRQIMVGLEPHLRSFNLTYTTSTQSDAFKKGTRFVRLIADADVYVEFGDAPVAVATSMRLEANQAEYFGVSGIRGLKLAAYDGSS